ncbi:MAG: thioether cross-link-forming SCIFF peptide maturase, partial [Anaerovoracaceae bacterium]
MIHQYRLNGYNIVLDVNSGSVHRVDDVAYDIIRYFCEAIDNGAEPDRDAIAKKITEKYGQSQGVTEQDARDCIDDIDELRAQGKLFSEDIYRPKASYLKDRNTEIKALCLHVAHTCNLNCSYCFASQGRFHGDRALMSFETAKRAMDFLIENSGNHRNLEVDFFGGEPLMNWDVVKQTVKYCRSIEKEHGKHFRFTLTTNGMGIDDDVIDFTNKEMNNVVLSLDGRKEVHDHLRKTINGKGSYDTIVPKFQKLVAARGDREYYMRGTFTHNNVDFTNDLFHMADDLGFKRLSIEPVVCSPDDPYA